MRVALSVWGNRISPVFDSAGQLLLVDVDRSIEIKREVINIDNLPPIKRASYLKNQEVDLLICGALTRSMVESLEANNIQYIPFICGNCEQIISALLQNQRIEELFKMPGCHEDYNE